MRKKVDIIDILILPWDFVRELSWFICAIFLAILARYRSKSVDVGLGPEPMINNVYHKKALNKLGYSAETYVSSVYLITRQFDHILRPKSGFLMYFIFQLHLFWHAVSRYKILYIYFNGGPFFATRYIWRLEPYLLQLARVKVVVMAYGGDVQDHSRNPNLLLKHATAVDYPGHGQKRRRIAGQIDLWTQHGDHILGGCDWVDYLYHWDSLQIAHFSMDTDAMAARAAAAPPRPLEAGTPLRVMHAPNHRTGKGTGFFLRAIEELVAEGVAIELVMLERVPNEEILEAILGCDVILDQLISGWYAMFAIEAMALGRPVVCNIRPDLHALYVGAGLLESGELPIIDASPRTVKDVLRSLAAMDRRQLADLGRRSQEYVRRHHSLEAIGTDFARINRLLGVLPSGNGDNLK